MCADDDFITAEGMTASVDFLETHPDYAFAQGYAYSFQPFGKSVVVWPIPYDNHEIAAAEWIDRVEQATHTVYYGVHRSAVLRGAIDFLARQDFSEILDSVAGFVDLCFLAGAARAGKFRRVSVPFGLREYSPHLSATGTRLATIVSRNVPDFYRNLVDWLMANEQSPSARDRLLRLCSRDYAGQIAFDLAGSRSRKRLLEKFGPAFARRVEFTYRLYTAARAYMSFAYGPALKLLWHPEYHRLKEFISPAGAQ